MNNLCVLWLLKYVGYDTDSDNVFVDQQTLHEDVAGDEVAQVYLNAPVEKPRGIQFAPKTLAAFARVTLAPKQTKSVTLHLAPRAFETWSTAENKWVRFGARTIEVSGSERDLKVSAAVE